MAENVSFPVVEVEAGSAARQELKVASAPAAGPATERLGSLDAFRGFIMFWIIGGEALAVGLQALGKNPVADTLIYELNHTPWQGLRFYDCIWPSFMLMTGVAIAFSVAKRSRTETSSQMMVHAVKRTTVLFLLGSFRESVSIRSPYLLELSSALQPIAIASFVAFLLAKKSQRVQAAVAVTILAAYALLLAFVPAPGIPAGTYAHNHNLVNYVDVALLPDHWAHWHYAKEGWGTLLSTIPTISTTLLGLILGGWLLSARPKEEKLMRIGAAGFLCLAVGYALSPVVPIVMKMWTTSYGLVSAGWSCLMFMLFFWVIDVRGHAKWSFPLVVIGSNAVFIYMFSSLMPLGDWVRIFTRSIGPQFEPFCHAAVVLGVESLMLYWMYKRKIFIKA